MKADMGKSLRKPLVHALFVTFFCLLAAFASAHCLSESSDASPSPTPSASPSSALPGPLGEDPDKFPVTLKVLWNGTVTARDSGTDEVRWSFSSGDPLSSAHGLLLDAYEGTNSSFSVTGDTVISEDEFVFCGTDWKLYSFDKGHGIKDLPIPPHELIQNTPTILNGVLILGTMSTSAFVLDARSGNLLHTFESRNELFSTYHLRKEELWRFLDLNFEEQMKSDCLLVFRKDYTIKSVAIASGALLWNVSVADVQLHHLNSEGIPHLPIGGERSNETYSLLSPAVPQPTLLPASCERCDRFLPVEIQVSQNSALQLAPAQHTSHSSTGHWSIGLACALLTAVCLVVAYVFQKRSMSKKNEEERQAQKKRRSRKPRAPVVAVPQEPTEGESNLFQGRVVCLELQSKADPPMTLNQPNDKHLILGNLCVTDKMIGLGSNGTIVFEGFLDKRPVAVKRMLKEHYDKAQKEINHLVKSDEHPNILRYFHVTSNEDFIFVALERCRCSLNDLILARSAQRSGSDEMNPMLREYSTFQLQNLKEKVGDTTDFQLWDDLARPSAKLLQLMRDILAGLSHLHEVSIVHRDLKPHNVLISGGHLSQAKLSDMGISKELVDGEIFQETHSTSSGSPGWQAPEQLERTGPQTRSIDLFSLGCILFFSISGGYHPFGPRLERDANIKHGKLDLFRVEHVPEAIDLISELLQHKPEHRPQMSTVRIHPLFWSCEKRLKFLCDASDRVELEDKENQSPIILDLEAVSQRTLGGSWDDKLDGVFLQNLGKYRKYKLTSVRDLLRVIRNKSSHFRELPQEVQKLFKSYPEGFETYFRSKFPRLLLDVFKVVYRHCVNEDGFKKYFLYDASFQ